MHLRFQRSETLTDLKEVRESSTNLHYLEDFYLGMMSPGIHFHPDVG